MYKKTSFFYTFFINKKAIKKIIKKQNDISKKYLKIRKISKSFY